MTKEHFLFTRVDEQLNNLWAQQAKKERTNKSELNRRVMVQYLQYQHHFGELENLTQKASV
jgi:hypothetical protein